MSPRLISLALVLLLQACALTPETAQVEPEEAPSQESMDEWLDVVESVQGLDAERARRELQRMNTNIQGTALFKFGLLSMHIGTYSSLNEAAESFQWRAEDETLSAGQNQLAALLRSHCQELLDWQLKYDQARRDLRSSQAANDRLQQKLDVLTELEVLFSDRKEEHSYRTED